MKTISILNLKGGVAKTFTAANMAYELYRRGYKVLLIDNDKQGNLSKAYSRYDAENVAPVTRLLAGDWESADELADNFLHVGQEQPTVLARVNGEYRIIDGHRRNAANILNLERGHKEYEKVLYRFMDMSEAMYELRLLAGNGYTQELTAYEKTRLVERTKAALIRAKEEDGLEIQGKMRDLVAAMINESSTNVARMDAINNNATPEIKEQLKEGNLGITAAYEAAKLDEDEQKEIAEKAAAGENVRAKEIAEKVAEKKAGDDYETPHPET